MSEEKQPPSYPVGYGKPPVGSRFPKGTSGNPGGRPRKTKPSTKPLDPASEPAIEMLAAEAYRKVTIREGEQQIELSVIQAIYRSLGVSAIKGNRHAAKTFAELVGTMEAGKREQQFEYFKAMYEYRESWLKVFEECDRAGKPRPDPTPHPDDIELNPVTGECVVRGPWSEEQRDFLLEVCERRDELVNENAELRAIGAKQKDFPPGIAAVIASNEGHIARFEAMLPPRMRHKKDWLAERLNERREERRAAAAARPDLHLVHSAEPGQGSAPVRSAGGKS